MLDTARKGKNVGAPRRMKKCYSLVGFYKMARKIPTTSHLQRSRRSSSELVSARPSELVFQTSSALQQGAQMEGAILVH